MDNKTQEEYLSEAKRLIEKLKINEEKVGKDVLKEKYAKAYSQLKRDIEKYTSPLLNEVMFMGMVVSTDPAYKREREAFIENVKRFLNEHSGAVTLIRKKLFEEYSLDGAFEVAAIINSHIMDKLYVDYLSGCCFEKNGRVFCPVLDMYWDEETGVWERDGRYKYYPSYKRKEA